MTTEGTLTAEVTVTLRCNGRPGCCNAFTPTPAAAGSVKAARDQAATVGWTSPGRDVDRCPECTAVAAAVPPAPSLFDESGADRPMRLARLRVDQAPADLEGRVPATATFSPDGTYRYDLTRAWAPGPLACWIMLNPSTADAFQLDPTLRRCQGFSQRWGAGGMLILNMFALRSTDPKGLVDHPDPVGADNDLVIAHHFSVGAPHVIGPVIVGWGPVTKLGAGRRQMMADRAAHLLTLLGSRGARPQCLKVLADGPGHPLYIPYEAAAVDYALPGVAA